MQRLMIFPHETFAYNLEDEFEWFAHEALEAEASNSGTEHIRWVQQSLNKILGLRLAVDGVMGAQTRSAIRSFQQRRGLVADGVVGAKTESALLSAGALPIGQFNKPQGSNSADPCAAPFLKTSSGQTKVGLIFNNIERPSEKPEDRDVLLYDYDINDHRLKPAHKATLDQLLKFMAEDAAQRLSSGQRWTVSIDGFASRTGTAQHNKLLSEKRADCVERYLRFNLPSELIGITADIVLFNRNFHGFDKTTVPGENPLGRSVRVAVHRPGRVPGPIKLPPAKTPGTATQFKIGLLGVVSLGVGAFASDAVVFEMVDLENKKAAFFLYLGAGAGVGINLASIAKLIKNLRPKLLKDILTKLKPPDISRTTAGPLICFKTTLPIRLSGFAGEATFTQVNPLISSDAILFFKSRPFVTLTSTRNKTIPTPVRVATGTTFLPLTVFSSTTGGLILLQEFQASQDTLSETCDPQISSLRKFGRVSPLKR